MGSCYHKYYKDKYMLAIYNMNDDLVGVFDNVRQLADWMDTTYDAIVSSVGRVLSGKCDCLIKNKIRYKVYTVEVDEE